MVDVHLYRDCWKRSSSQPVEFSSIGTRTRDPALRIIELQQSKLAGSERRAFAVQGGRRAGPGRETTLPLPQLACCSLAVGAAHQRFQTGGDFNQRKVCIDSHQAEPKPSTRWLRRRAGGKDQVPVHGGLCRAIRAGYPAHQCREGSGPE